MMGKPLPTRAVTCYLCRHTFLGSEKAVSVNCPSCHKRLNVSDFVIEGAQRLRTVQTCGRILIGKRGSLVATTLHASEGIEVLGHLEGRAVSEGPVYIGPKARWKGDLDAPWLEICAGATVEGFLNIVPPPSAEPEPVDEHADPEFNDPSPTDARAPRFSIAAILRVARSGAAQP